MTGVNDGPRISWRKSGARLGPRAGQKVLSVRTVAGRDQKITHGPCAEAHGFSLHAGVGCGADQRKQLERPNHRLLGLDDQGNVRFSWRDRAHGNRRRIMQLPAAQFLDRFVLHVLPLGLVRIRHIGFLANRHKRQQLAQARTALAAPAPAPHSRSPPSSFACACWASTSSAVPPADSGTFRIVAQIPAAHAPYQARAP